MTKKKPEIRPSNLDRQTEGLKPSNITPKPLPPVQKPRPSANDKKK